MRHTYRNDQPPTDLPAAAFVALTQSLFDRRGIPIPFTLRGKGETQDDPFDEHIADVLERTLPPELRVLRAGKPLVNPDIVLARPEEYRLLANGGEDFDTRSIVAIEVKKISPDKATGLPARGSGMDYNSTPPCETVRLYSERNEEILVPSFYLFALLGQAHDTQQVYVESMALVAGAALSKDTELYDRITGRRKKAIGLGTYGDGADRQRPMLVFANPLGWSWMQKQATLISEREDLHEEFPDLAYVRSITRSWKPVEGLQPRKERFHCYRVAALDSRVEDPVEDPFPTPKNRTEETAQRGRFKIDLLRDSIF
ncbi:hypothetical protein QJ054_25960 [Streptomyces sp. AN-3]|uniref:hypothetical protein n=1 Tax=Streptomyces sp. AN-3 TaxID=3044177 RepID=UPI00249B6508|nr:hypothetical protein [Streptomyces sp. AN-3]MDI3100502.1 hypothetical protein [Streptomyces sp. AN-3]